MPFNRPSLKELSEQILGNFSTETLGGAPVQKQTVLYALAQSVAGAVHLLHGHLDWNSKQILPKTASPENIKLWSNRYKMLPREAQYASGFIQFNGVEGTSIPLDLILVRADGTRFKTIGTAVLKVNPQLANPSQATGQVECICETPGEIGNTELKATLTLIAPLEKVNSTATVLYYKLKHTAIDTRFGIYGGVNAESIVDFNQRVIDYGSAVPRCGNLEDLEYWMREIPFVDQAKAYFQGGKVTIISFSTKGTSLTPTEEQISYVESYIKDRQNCWSMILFVPAKQVPIPFSIQIKPDTPVNRMIIESALKDFFIQAGRFNESIPLSSIHRTIVKAISLTSYKVKLPSDDIGVTGSDLPRLGAVEWT